MSADPTSQYNQSSFVGGMNLLGDDSRLQPNQYRVGFDMTNRFDELDLMAESILDPSTPPGIMQESATFGNFIVLFVSGKAFYRHYTQLGWIQIPGFAMSVDAPRYWSVVIPVATTNYVRIAVAGLVNTNTSNPQAGIQLSNIAGAAGGNLPGLLVQDNINQPQFIFINGSTQQPTCRITQTFDQWRITFIGADNAVVAVDTDGNVQDFREYVPIGNTMAWANGILMIASQDGQIIYRSVSGRPLDFVVNVPAKLADNTTTPPYTLFGGGDVLTTAYSVGVGGISCIRPLSTGGWFVAASNANFAVTLNTTQNATTIYGEYTFLRQFLFNSNCLSDRGILDTIGDTRFVDLSGVRSFNAIEQAQNEGRNSVFTSNIQKAFNGITQSTDKVAAILFDNYEMYAMNTIFGYAIAKYDTVNGCWVAFDRLQTNGKAIKMLFKLEIDVQRLYAITEDNKLYNLYAGTKATVGTVRTVGVCANMLYANENIKMNNPDTEVQLRDCRIVMNNITTDVELSFTPYVNNRLTRQPSVEKSVTYKEATIISSLPTDLPDVNTQLQNLLFPTPNCGQGWKVFGIISWNAGTITQYSMDLNNATPMNPLLSQGSTK